MFLHLILAAADHENGQSFERPPDSDQLVALHVAKKYSFRNVPSVLPKHIIQREANHEPRIANVDLGDSLCDLMDDVSTHI